MTSEDKKRADATVHKWTRAELRARDMYAILVRLRARGPISPEIDNEIGQIIKFVEGV